MFALFCLFALAPGVHVTVDASKAPDLQAWGDRGAALITAWAPKISKVIGEPLPAELDVKIVFDPGYNGVAYTVGRTITVATGWVRAHPDDIGLLVHEMTHVVQAYHGRQPGWLVEGIADYVRWVRYEPGKGLSLPVLNDTYREAYRVAARFLDWAQRNGKDHHLVRDLSRTMKANEYAKGTWTTLTGQSVDQLWAEYIQADSWMIGPFHRPAVSGPVLTPSSAPTFSDPMTGSRVAWMTGHTFNPAAVTAGGKVALLFRAEDATGSGIGDHTSRIGIAWSRDGMSFHVRAKPVLFPGAPKGVTMDVPGGCEDPRVVSNPRGGYVMTYTSWDRRTPRLSIATSPDLTHWTKRGAAFAASYSNSATKSGAIVTKRVGDRLVAAKIGGSYWMYWGSGDICLAKSSDLIHWNPVLGPDGGLRVVLQVRRGDFDSDLVEPGPPALVTPNGILLLYNGENSTRGGDANLAPRAYSAGEALFSGSDPARVIMRSRTPILAPERAYEKTGQYAQGTVFVEGLTPFKGKWVLYFGAADSDVGEAFAPLKF